MVSHYELATNARVDRDYGHPAGRVCGSASANTASAAQEWIPVVLNRPILGLCHAQATLVRRVANGDMADCRRRQIRVLTDEVPGTYDRVG